MHGTGWRFRRIKLVLRKNRHQYYRYVKLDKANENYVDEVSTLHSHVAEENPPSIRKKLR